MQVRVLVIPAVVALTSGSAFASNLACSGSYGFRVDVNGTIGNTVCASTAQDVLDAAKDLKKSNTTYTETSSAFGVGRFNGVNFNIKYDENSTELTFDSDDINEHKVFKGNTRNETEDQLEDWFKKSDVPTKIMQHQSKNSAASPITGSGGLMTSLAAVDYATGIEGVSNISTTSTASGTSTASDGNSTGTINILGTMLTGGAYKVADTGERIRTTTLPLSYSIGTSTKDDRSQLIFTLPLTMYQVSKAKGYHAGFGVAHRFPVTSKWTLTPGVRYALTGSVDRATVAAVYSGSLMSIYQIPVGSWSVSMGNMVGYYKTGKFKVGDYSFNPNINQTMFRNGLMLSQPIELANTKLAIEYSFVDTRYVGSDKPFMSNMQEFGITLGLHKNQEEKLSVFRAGVNYINAKGSRGVTFNVGYWF